MKAASLLYHDVVHDGRFEETGFVGAGPDRYKLDADDFTRHLQALGERLARPPSRVEEVAAAGPLAWLLTFDDGGASARYIGERLRERGWQGHFFITTDRIGSRGFVTAEDVTSLAQLNHVIGSHSCSHPERMSRCSWEQLLDEWQRSVDVLGNILGRPVSVASVPGGDYNDRVARAAAAAGIENLFTSEPQLRVHSVDGCSVFGRFAIVRGVSSDRAVALALGRARPRLGQFVSWKARRSARAVGGRHYLRLRRFLLRRLG